MPKQKSFGITVSLKHIGGLIHNSDLEKDLLTVIKRADYYHAVAETKQGQPDSRHLHAQLWYTNPKDKGDIKKNYIRVLRKQHWWEEKNRDVCFHIKYCFSDWFENYLSKENEDKANDISELLLDQNPVLHNVNPEDFYPTDEQQEGFKNKANAVDKKFYRWEELWNEYEHKVENPELIDIAKFLGDMMFVSRKIQVIVDDKARKQNCVCLLAYIQKSKSAKLFLTKEQWEIHCLQLEANSESS
jgi:hypothetical protein